jgi:hypothetical protein
MKMSDLINRINTKFTDIVVNETDIWFKESSVKGLIFSLKNQNKDKDIQNPYEAALDLIRYGESVMEVTIVEWDKCKAFTYYIDENGGIAFTEDDFDRFVELNDNKPGKRFKDIFFKVLPLEDNNLIDLSKMNNFKEVIKYIENLCYENPLRNISLDFELLDLLQEADNGKDINIVEEQNNSITLQSIFSTDLPY